jgi:hypothetical protein
LSHFKVFATPKPPPNISASVETKDVTLDTHADSQGYISGTVYNPLTIPLDGTLTLTLFSNEWKREFNVLVNVPPRSTETFRIYIAERNCHIPLWHIWDKDREGNVFDTIDMIEKRSGRPGLR